MNRFLFLTSFLYLLFLVNCTRRTSRQTETFLSKDVQENIHIIPGYKNETIVKNIIAAAGVTMDSGGEPIERSGYMDLFDSQYGTLYRDTVPSFIRVDVGNDNNILLINSFGDYKLTLTIGRSTQQSSLMLGGGMTMILDPKSDTIRYSRSEALLFETLASSIEINTFLHNQPPYYLKVTYSGIYPKDQRKVNIVSEFYILNELF